MKKWILCFIAVYLTACSSLVAQPTPANLNTEITHVNVFPNSETLHWKAIVSGLEFPTDIRNAGDGSGRLFVLEKAGRIRILDSEGALLDKPFLDIRKRVGSRENEQGLLGLVFHPDFSENGFFYVYYTNKDGNTVVSRFQASENINLANPDSELIILTQYQPKGGHNGGGLAFGPDGYLYISIGDGGGEGDPQGVGQNLNIWLGKILRIDVNSDSPYSIPADNPFVNGGGFLNLFPKGLPEIWAYGLRNPWRISFDTLTDDFYIADVGQYKWEEVNVVSAGSPKGLNFGWNIMEANHPFSEEEIENTPEGLTMPVFEFAHGDYCAIMGGYVYRGQNIPELQGVYLFGDFCSGTIWGLLKSPSGWQSSVLFDTDFTISTFGVDEAGELYLGSYDGGIYKLERTP